jgi:quinol monooxygenase YgiN
MVTPPQRALELERLWDRTIAGILRRQPSCVRVDLLRNRERPGEYIGVTEWEGQEALSGYMASADFGELLLLLEEVTVTAPTLKTYETVGG